jgi:pimeloyl-ACP methyl ester carboxylesterase
VSGPGKEVEENAGEGKQRGIIMMIKSRKLSDHGPSLYFLHANGYPPQAYNEFLNPFLNQFSVQVLFLRPFQLEADPQDLKDWRDFRDDYLTYIENTNYQLNSGGRIGSEQPIIGLGHSIGAMTTLMAAIKAPEQFSALVLIEPTLFPLWQGTIMRLAARINLAPHVYPLIKNTLKRKTIFTDRDEMFIRYRKKTIFMDISDKVLRDYVNGLAEDLPDGKIGLKYSPAWEARIYSTAGIADWYVWNNLSKITIPVLVLRGETSDTLREATLNRMVKKMNRGQGLSLPNGGHLLPLEKPIQTAAIVLEYLEAVS